MTYSLEIKNTKEAYTLIEYLRTLKYVRFINDDVKVKSKKKKKDKK